MVSFECILCPVRGRKLVGEDKAEAVNVMHPMPREGTETAVEVVVHVVNV